MVALGYSRRVAGSVQSAELLSYKLHHRKKARHTAAQAAGIRYEKLALSHLVELVPLVPHPAFKFFASGFDQYAIPDAIVVDAAERILTIIEIKIRHTSDACFQLNNLYKPIVQKAFPHMLVNLLEVCKSFDAEVSLPQHFKLVQDPVHFTKSYQSGVLGIYVYSGR